MLSAFAFACLLLGPCPWLGTPCVAYEVQVNGLGQLALDPLLRKERVLERAVGALQEDQVLSRPPPGDSRNSSNGTFNSSSGMWKMIRDKAKVTAVDKFSAEGPPPIFRSETTSAAATIILGVVTCFVGVFCLLHGDFKQGTWKSLNASCCWFSALLVYYLIREITNLMVEDETVLEEVSLKEGLRRLPNLPPAASAGPGAVTVAILRFLLGFCILQIILTSGRDRKVLIIVATSFGAQLVGLLGADAFATWQETPAFNGSAGNSFGLVCSAVSCVALLLWMAYRARGKVIGSDAALPAATEELFRQSDCTVAALTISLTLVQFLRFACAGRLPHFLGVQRSGYKRSETAYLFIALPLLMLATFLAERGFKVPTGSSISNGVLIRTIGMCTVQTLAFSTAWCLFFWSKWLDHGFLMGSGNVALAGDVMKIEIYSVIAFSVATVGCAIAVEIHEEKLPDFKSLFGLLCQTITFSMTLAWNSCFQTACAFSKDPKASPFDQVFARCTQTQWMCVLLIPSWLLFILPRVSAAEPSSDAKEGESGPDAEKAADKEKKGGSASPKGASTKGASKGGKGTAAKDAAAAPAAETASGESATAAAPAVPSEAAPATESKESAPRAE